MRKVQAEGARVTQMGLRLPFDLYQQIVERAGYHERSLQSEIIFSLRRYYEVTSRPERVNGVTH